MKEEEGWKIEWWGRKCRRECSGLDRRRAIGVRGAVGGG